MAKPNRYKQMEQYMTIALIANLFLFILCLCVSSIIWMKIILSVFIILISIVCLIYLYMSKELLKPRSLWMTSGAASILACQLASIILNFP